MSVEKNLFLLGVDGRKALFAEEGRRLKAYRDQGGVWTIGDGHIKTARAGMVITNEQADALLEQDIADHAQPLVDALNNAPTTRSQLDAMVIAAFNVGVAGFKRSRVIEAHKTGDVEAVRRAWARLPVTVDGVPHPVLIKRRAREFERYLSHDDDYVLGGPQSRVPVRSTLLPEDGQHASPTPDQHTTEKPLSESRTIGGGAVAAGAAGVAAVKEAAGEVETVKTAVGGVRGFVESTLGIPWDVFAPTMFYGLMALAVAGGVYAIYARIDDRLKGRN